MSPLQAPVKPSSSGHSLQMPLDGLIDKDNTLNFHYSTVYSKRKHKLFPNISTVLLVLVQD